MQEYFAAPYVEPCSRGEGMYKWIERAKETFPEWAK